MNIYSAPMEGLTGYVFRRVHSDYFGGIDKYFTPFLSPTQNHRMSARETKEVLPENNRGITVVPQIMTNKAEDFIWAVDRMGELGYREVNLNLGCPSGTVVSKKKGSGFLSMPDQLDRFFEQVFDAASLDISVKTRIGLVVPEEFEGLMEIYNRYPISELTIHPRLRTDFYKNTPRMDSFRMGEACSVNPVCYNGDLFTAEAYREFADGFPGVKAVMLGRGLIANPGLALEIRGGGLMEKQRFYAFHQDLLEAYRETIPGDKNVLFRMKEMWFYMIQMFANHERYAKKINKSQKMEEYRAAVELLFQEQELVPGAGFKAVQ